MRNARWRGAALAVFLRVACVRAPAHTLPDLPPPHTQHTRNPTDARTPCTMSSPHYHANAGELSLSIGPDASQYILMLSEDMRRPMFST